VNQRRTTLGKALYINQDPRLYGTFAEIGAGQEVARFFFQAGKASQTIAKTISAYDMTFSDEIYGREKNGRYVCESRLNKMLQKEFDLLPERLAKIRGDHTQFFAFASTVATSSDTSRSCHGWMGLRFQTEANGPTNDVIMHVRMLDRHRLQQQEVLGILGVNLLFAAFYYRQDPDAFLTILTEDIKEGRLSIDLIRFSGPTFHQFDDLFMNLELVRRNLCDAALFGPKHDLLYCGDVLYQKPLLVGRGTFSPPTNTHMEILEKATQQLQADKNLKPLIVCEISLPEAELSSPHLTINEDLRHRIKMLNSLGYHVLISRFPLFFELKSFFRQYTQATVSFVISAVMLEKLFEAKFYQSLTGGLLEGLGRLLDDHTHLYVYPHKTDEVCLTLDTFSISGPEQHVFEYFRKRTWIKELGQCDLANLAIHSSEVRELLQTGKDVSQLLPQTILKYLAAHPIYKTGLEGNTPMTLSTPEKRSTH
jgi:nicotinic acid mononucleotide adenylyltransferase